ncbi:MAG: enoyl-CoA hydratase [Myxococcales bacterium]|mgnify:CR=1 FL=1|nr:enoyl-CoA hydratase [Myxococcales bacterium]|tara:strand:- start:1478 stop:2353 length:876 start_codon:yes stop_codon:yes gene_type:complete
MNQIIRADRFGDDGIIRVSYEKRGRVALFTLKDENLNGYTYKMFRDLDDCILRARFDPDVEAIIITGNGEHFCAGANINMLEAADATSKYYFCLHANETVSRLEQTPKLVIAAINGHCVGGGFEIALGCDLRIARNGGGRVGLPEVSLGVLPGTGGTQRLTRLIGASKAMEMMLSGQTYPVSKGADLGLVHRVIGETETKEIKGKQRTVAAMSRDEFIDEVVSIANGYCSPDRAGLAVGHIKRAVQSGGELPLESGLALERELQAKLFSSDDAREGLAAFVEKRKASFTGQ